MVRSTQTDLFGEEATALESQPLENNSPSPVTPRSLEDAPDDSSSSPVPEHSGQPHNRWSVWLGTFAALNVLFFTLLSSLFVGDSGAPSSAAEDSRVFVYSLVLGLIVAAGVGLLVFEYARELPERALRFGVDVVAITLTLALAVIGLLMLSVGSPIEEARSFVEQSVWSLLVVAWWLYLRERLTQELQCAPGCGFGLEELTRSSSISSYQSDSHPEGMQKLDAGSRSSATLEVSRGLALVRLRGGGKEEVPVLRQAGDVLYPGSFVLKGSLECIQASGHYGAPAHETGWTHTLFQSLARQNEGELKARAGRLRQVYLGVAVVVVSLLSINAWGGGVAFFSGLQLGVPQILALLAVVPAIELLIALQLFVFGASARFFQAGLTFKSFSFFRQLTKVKRVVFRIGARSPLVGAAKAKEFQLIDERVDGSRFFGVVFALLRNADDPALVAIRNYCYTNSSRPELFRVEQSETDGSEYIRGVIQGAQFFVGTEEALVARGVHLEVSEAFIGQGSLLKRYYVAVGDEVVASFLVEPPFFAEMPHLVEALRSTGIRPMLEGVGVDDTELDRLGKELGFELADIRTAGESSRQSRRESAPKSDTLWVILSPEEGLPSVLGEAFGAQGDPGKAEDASGGAPLLLSWFRESLWNVSFPGVLLLGRELIPVQRIFSFARSYEAMRLAFSFGMAILIGFGVLNLFIPIMAVPTLLALSVGLLLVGVLSLRAFLARFAVLS